MSKQKPLLETIICDDVREESGGRLSFMGVYPGRRIITQQLPTIINQLAFVMRLRNLGREGEILVKIESPDGHEALLTKGRVVDVDDEGVTTFVIQAAPIQISKPGAHKLLVKTGKHTILNEFYIKQPS